MKKTLSTALIFIVVFSTFAMCTIQSSRSVTENPYRKKIIVDNSGNPETLTDYQVFLNVTYDSDMQADFDDLRFTWLNETSGEEVDMDYWLDKYVDSEYALAWVEVPEIRGSGEEILYMYYGNPYAVSESNGEETFVFFDGFSTDTTANYELWSSIMPLPGGNPYNEFSWDPNGWLFVNASESEGGGRNSNVHVTHKTALIDAREEKFWLETRGKAFGTGDLDYFGVGEPYKRDSYPSAMYELYYLLRRGSPPSTMNRTCIQSLWASEWEFVECENVPVPTKDEWYRFGVGTSPNGTVIGRFYDDDYNEVEPVVNQTIHQDNEWWVDLLVSRSCSDTWATLCAYFDYVRVRKFTDPEPRCTISECVWVPTTPLPNPSSAHHCTVHDNRIYVVGGSTPISGIRYDRVLYGSVQPDGHIDPDGWQYTTPLPDARTNAPVVVYENWIYVLDGSASQPGIPYIERDTVWYASFNPDGTLGSWTETTTLPYRGCEEAVQWNGRIYIMAGWDGYSQHDDVYYATINPADGSLGSWIRTTTLPREYSHGHATAVHNGVIYFIGGNRAYPLYHAREVYYSIIQESGELGPWIETAPLPVPLESHDAVICGDDLFAIGGRDDTGAFSNLVYKAHINPDSSLDDWEEYCTLPESIAYVGSVCLNSRIYVIGGHLPSGIIVDTVYFTCLVPLPVPATVDIDPDTLNLKSNGQWITAYVELPEEYSVSEIDVSSILLNGSISVDPEAPTGIADYDADSISDLMVKFERAAVIEWLGTVDYGEDSGKTIEVNLVITGQAAGTPFEGVDTVRVLLKS